MASGDGQFDLRALQRVGDFTNDRAEWKRWSFVSRGYVGAASPLLLELMTRVTELQGEITYDALNEDDNALDHRLHYVLALVLKGDALDMLMNQEPGRGLACWRELVLLHEPRSAGHCGGETRRDPPWDESLWNLESQDRAVGTTCQRL